MLAFALALAPMSAPKESIIFEILFHSSFSSNATKAFPCSVPELLLYFNPVADVEWVAVEEGGSFTGLSSDDVGVYGRRLTTIMYKHVQIYDNCQCLNRLYYLVIYRPLTYDNSTWNIRN